MVLLRNGDLYIRANLTYTNDSWASANQIPALYFLVNGDIYIHNDVTQLDGIFFATGSVYTCATGSGPVALGDVFEACDNPLQINGSLIADTVYFNRYADSTLSHGTQTEFPYGAGNNNCSPSRPVCAAEIINFSPETFLSHPQFPIGSPSLPRGTYDAIIGLPPVL